MTDCPKCGGVSTMRGPTYCDGGCQSVVGRLYRQEHLHYRCEVCGYVAQRPTADHAGKKALPSAGAAGSEGQ